jgi:protein-tyrosine phosphatase
MAIEAFLSGPLVIDAIAAGRGALGLTHCPGRKGTDMRGRVWRRDLAADLDTIAAWGARLVVTLTEAHEFARHGVPDLGAAVAARGLDWRHFPIPDMGAPAAGADLRHLVDEIEAILDDGGRVLVHCAAGMGRTGTLAALLLVDGFGETVEAAVARVRAARPGTVESAAQMTFLAAWTPRRPR